MGMSKRLRRLRRKVRHTVEDVVKAPGKIVKEGADVVAGKKKLDDAIKDSLHVALRPVKDTAEAIAQTDAIMQKLTEKIAAKVGGDEARDLVADINRAVRYVVEPQVAVALVESLDMFVDTGDLKYLNPFMIYCAGELRAMYEQLSDIAHPIPTDVVNALPPEVREIAHNVRYLTRDEVPGNINFADIATGSEDKTAITLIDIIVFRRVPGATTENDLFLWTHELFHVGQYRKLGCEEFVQSYLGNEWGFEAAGNQYPGNPMEVNADLFACSYFPGGTAVYLPGQRCPISS